MLIIYAHPNRDGHCGCLLKNIEEHLKKRDKEYEILDLYRDSFYPVLKQEEHYTSGHNEVSAEVKEIQRKINSSEKLIFLYPTWWQNMPSILKGFIDRVFTPRFAFIYKGKLSKGILKGKKAAIFTSTGAPRLFTRIFAADRNTKALKKDVLCFCGISTKAFTIDKAEQLTSVQEERIKLLIEKGMKYLAE
jgi:NAD(P)H dehydrogenase (quinone)